MLHVFVDTNVFYRIVTQGRPGCELVAYERLKTLVSGEVVRLLVPEVVLLELQKHRRLLANDLKERLGNLKKHINTFEYWSEIADVRGRLLKVVHEEKEAKLERAEELFDDVLSFLGSSAVIGLELTPDILCRARKRTIAGWMPRCGQRSDQDAAIIESLVAYFDTRGRDHHELLFCSENHTDFAEPLGTQTRDRKFKLNSVIATDLPSTKYYTDLDSLLEFDEGYESTFVPSAARPAYDPVANEPDWNVIEQQSRTEIEAHYCAEVLPKLPELIVQRRKELVRSIQGLLAACRACRSWGDRSELKLCQWLEYVDEYAIPYTSVSNLVAIERNLVRYLEIHKEADEQEAATTNENAGS